MPEDRDLSFQNFYLSGISFYCQIDTRQFSSFLEMKEENFRHDVLVRTFLSNY